MIKTKKFKKLQSLLSLILMFCMILTASGCKTGSSDAASLKAESDTAIPSESQSADGDTTQADSYPEIKVGIITLNLEAQYWLDTTEGLKSTIESRGGTVVLYSSENDVQKAVQQVEDMITKQFDVIVLTCVDKEGLRPALQQAKDANIPVIVYDKKTDDVDLVVTQIQTNDYNIGAFLAEQLAAALDYKGKVMSVNTPSVSVQSRNKGFSETIAKYPDMELIIGEAASALADVTLPVAESMLHKDTDIKGWLGINETQTIGALSAIEGAQADILVYSLEPSATMRAFMHEGKVHCLVDQQPYYMGALIGESCYDILLGKTLEPTIEVPFGLVTPDTLDEYEANLPGTK